MSEYESHKERMRRNMSKGGKYYISQKARAEAIKLLIRKYKTEFDELVKNLKKEMEVK